jgi:hypothetical protein
MYYVGCYFFDRYISLFATVLMALAPSAMMWGRQMRMYEQAQLITILTIFLLYKALRNPERPRLIYLGVGALCLAYLSHEEIFITFPGFMLCILMSSFIESRSYRVKFQGLKRYLPPILFQKHWWYATILGALVIVAELASGKLSHPTFLGTDQSQEPMINFSTVNIAFYIKLLFYPPALGTSAGNQPWIMLTAALSLVGTIWAVRASDPRASYLGLLFWSSVATLAALFSLTSDRYLYPIFPMMYMSASYALLNGLRAVWRVMSSPLEVQREGTGRSGTIPYGPLRLVMNMTQLLLCATVLLLPMLPFSGYNLLVSRSTGLLFHRHYPDYDNAGQYVLSHWQPGDVVVAIAPTTSIRYYVQHDEYFISLDRALYLFEKNGTITDTPTGETPLLSQSDFLAVLASHVHNRIWIVTDNGNYLLLSTRDGRFTIPPDFHVVYEGFGSAVYVRGT